jgi:hypothetical protein
MTGVAILAAHKLPIVPRVVGGPYDFGRSEYTMDPMSTKDVISDTGAMQAQVYKLRVRHLAMALVVIAAIVVGMAVFSAEAGWVSIVIVAALLAYGFEQLAGDPSAANRVPE